MDSLEQRDDKAIAQGCIFQEKKKMAPQVQRDTAGSVCGCVKI